MAPKAHNKPLTRPKVTKAPAKSSPKNKPKAVPKPVQRDIPTTARLYNCKKCLTRHEPPTGAKCTNPGPTDMSSTRIEDTGDNTPNQSGSRNQSGSSIRSNSRRGDESASHHSLQGRRESYDPGHNDRDYYDQGADNDQDYYVQGADNGSRYINYAADQAPQAYPTQNLPGSAQNGLPREGYQPPPREGYQPPPRDLGPTQGAFPQYNPQDYPRDSGPTQGAFPQYNPQDYGQQGYLPPVREGYQPPNPRDLGPLAAAFAQPQPHPTGTFPYSGIHQSMGHPAGAYAQPPPVGYPPAAAVPNPEMGEVMRQLQNLSSAVATIQANQNNHNYSMHNNPNYNNYSMHNNQFPSGRSREQDPQNMSTRSERWAGHPRPGRAAANGPPMHAAQHPNTAHQEVNQRGGALGDHAAARPGGGQGAYNIHPHPNINHTANAYPNLPTYEQQCLQPVAEQSAYVGSSPVLSKRISSGRDRTGNDGVARIYVPWPNEFCLIGIDRNKVRYDQLNQGQWQSGLLNIVAQERDPILAKHMLAHITKLAKDAVDCGFRLAKGAHAAVLCALEEGRVTWAEPDAIEEIRRDSVSRIFIEAEAFSRPVFQQSANTGAKPKVQGKNKNVSVCKLFNRGTCTHDADHTNGNIEYLHVCAYCRANGKSVPIEERIYTPGACV